MARAEKKKPHPPIDPQTVKGEVAGLLLQASVLQVHDPASHRMAREIRRDAKIITLRAEAHFDELKEPLQEPIRKLNAEEKEITAPAKKVLGYLDPQIIAFEELEAGQREQLQRDLEAEARQQAQIVRDGMIQDLIARGEIARAEALKSQPLHVPPVVIPNSDNYLPGEGRHSSWGVDEENVDIIEICKAVIAGQLPTTAVEPNFKALHNLADAVRQSGSVPGCVIKRYITITQRS